MRQKRARGKIQIHILKGGSCLSRARVSQVNLRRYECSDSHDLVLDDPEDEQFFLLLETLDLLILSMIFINHFMSSFAIHSSASIGSFLFIFRSLYFASFSFFLWLDNFSHSRFNSIKFLPFSLSPTCESIFANKCVYSSPTKNIGGWRV